MYRPRHFEQNDPAALRALMQSHPLATLVTQSADNLTADHVPLLYDPADGEHGTLVGHVARANPLWQHAAAKPVLVVFGGHQAYISPNWYPGKAETHKVVPTWNYAVVHAHGVLEAVHDAGWLRALVGRLSSTHEAGMPQPWSLNDAPEDFVQQMLRAIVGIRIPVTQLVGKWKLSQNKGSDDVDALARGLETRNDAGAQALALMMRKLPKETT
jgi:transcriptional regulator